MSAKRARYAQSEGPVRKNEFVFEHKEGALKF